MVKLQNVCCSENGSVILNNITFCADKNSTTIIYYDSGSGATSLAKILCGLSSPTSGVALLGNKTANPKESGASLLLSKPVYFKHKSALKNLLVSAKKIKYNGSKEQAQKVLSKFGINPNQKVKKMQTDEQIIFCFARSEFFNKNFIISDDIFRNLTQEQMQNVFSVFKNFIQNKTLVIFDSTKTVDIPNSQKYYLSFGSLYPFEEEPRLWQIYCMTKNPTETHKGTLVESAKKIVIKENNKTYLVNNRSLLAAKERGVQEVLFVLNGEKVVAVFDAMDFERIL